MVRNIIPWVPPELEAETRFPLVTRIMEWVSITALLMVVSWRPFASYQIPLDLVVCAGAVMGVLALISSNTESGLTTASITERP